MKRIFKNIIDYINPDNIPNDEVYTPMPGERGVLVRI